MLNLALLDSRAMLSDFDGRELELGALLAWWLVFLVVCLYVTRPKLGWSRSVLTLLQRKRAY